MCLHYVNPHVVCTENMSRWPTNLQQFYHVKKDKKISERFFRPDVRSTPLWLQAVLKENSGTMYWQDIPNEVAHRVTHNVSLDASH